MKNVLALIGIIIFVALCGVGFYFLESYDKTYYTQIDNTKIATITSSDEMRYEYTLTAYAEDGKPKELKFKTSRELREDAYLMLKVRILGVHSWAEVNYDELPRPVKDRY